MTTTYHSVLDLIGHTPLVRVTNIDTGPCELYLKLENQNPGGSIKDRIALRMIDDAEAAGLIKPGDTIVEATAGNTGIALALVAAQRGYTLKLVIPDKMSQEKINHLRAMGAEVVLTRSDVGVGHPEYYQDMARAIAENTPNAYYINQFANPSNPAAHEATTAPEIYEGMGGKVDAIVVGVGSGGTLTGIGRYFKRVSPATQMVLADPKGSILATYVQRGVIPPVGSWLVEGIGEDFIPDTCDIALVDKAYTIEDTDSIATAQLLVQKTGILCGSSSGTLIAAALRYCREQKTPKRVVTFVCDSGNKYLSKIYNPYWLNDQGIGQDDPTGDLHDLIARSYFRGEVVWARPDEALQSVFKKMKTFDVSQIPVITQDEIIGLIDESDLLTAVIGNPGGFKAPASAVMTKKLVKVDVKTPQSELPAIFERGQVACVTENHKFLGIITPVDLLNHLRHRTGLA